MEAQAQRSHALLFTSALGGVPPFYVVSVVAGVLRLGFGGFLLMGCCGRFLRFALIVALPPLVMWVWP